MIIPEDDPDTQGARMAFQKQAWDLKSKSSKDVNVVLTAHKCFWNAPQVKVINSYPIAHIMWFDKLMNRENNIFQGR